MTLADLQEDVWHRLPALRKRIAGRDAVDSIVAQAVANWPGEFMGSANSDTERLVVCNGLLVAVKRGCQLESGYDAQEYGFVWMLLLQALASLAVQLILKWWLERRSHRALLTVWQHELTGGAAT